MIPKSPIEAISFSDGFVTVKKGETVIGTFAYGTESVGYKRYYAARAANVRINKVIHIPRFDGVEAQMTAVIDDDKYRIDSAVVKTTTNPAITVLTLLKVGG